MLMVDGLVMGIPGYATNQVTMVITVLLRPFETTEIIVVTEEYEEEEEKEPEEEVPAI